MADRDLRAVRYEWPADQHAVRFQQVKRFFKFHAVEFVLQLHFLVQIPARVEHTAKRQIAGCDCLADAFTIGTLFTDVLQFVGDAFFVEPSARFFLGRALGMLVNCDHISASLGLGSVSEMFVLFREHIAAVMVAHRHDQSDPEHIAE